MNCYTCTYSLCSSTTEVTPRTSTITIGHLCNSAFTIHLAAKLQHRQSSHLRRISDRRHTVSLMQLARQRGSLLSREQRGQTALLGCCAAQRWASMSAMNTQGPTLSGRFLAVTHPQRVESETPLFALEIEYFLVNGTPAYTRHLEPKCYKMTRCQCNSW